MCLLQYDLSIIYPNSSFLTHELVIKNVTIAAGAQMRKLQIRMLYTPDCDVIFFKLLRCALFVSNVYNLFVVFFLKSNDV